MFRFLDGDGGETAGMGRGSDRMYTIFFSAVLLLGVLNFAVIATMSGPSKQEWYDASLPAERVRAGQTKNASNAQGHTGASSVAAVRAGEQAQIAAPINAAVTQDLSHGQRTRGSPLLHAAPSPAIGLSGNLQPEALGSRNVAIAEEGNVAGGRSQGGMDAAGSIGGTALERQDSGSHRQGTGLSPDINGQGRVREAHARGGEEMAGIGGGGGEHRSGSVGGERAGAREVRGSAEEGAAGAMANAAGGEEGAGVAEGVGARRDRATREPAAPLSGGQPGGGGAGGGGGVTRRYSPADLPVVVTALLPLPSTFNPAHPPPETSTLISGLYSLNPNPYIPRPKP